MLEIADGLKDALIHSGFTIESILNRGPGQIASTIGIDVYVAKIIFRAAKKTVNTDGSMQQNNLTSDNTATYAPAPPDNGYPTICKYSCNLFIPS